MHFNYMALSLWGITLAASSIAAPGPAVAQGRYEPVVKEDVVKLDFAHYYTPDDKYRDRDFKWSFRGSTFLIKKGDGPIPNHLLERLLGKGVTAAVIRGKWKLVNEEGGKLVLTDIKAGEIVGKKKVSFPIYRTAPTVVRIGQPQFVFAVKAKETAADSGGNDEVRSADPRQPKSK